MAITLTVDDLINALKIHPSIDATEEITRLLKYVKTAIKKYAPDAPEEVANQAATRLAGYLYDQPIRGVIHANALRNSGAGNILLPYRIHRAGLT